VQWPRRRRPGRSRRYSDLSSWSRLHSRRSVLCLTLLRHQSLQPHAPGSSPQHVRCRRQGFLAQNRNDPSKSHCARRIKSLRTRNGRASHSSSVSRPGKLRVGLPFIVLPSLLVTTGLDPVVHGEWLRPMSVLRSSMGGRVKPGNDEPFRSRDAATHPSFAYAKKSQAKKHSQKTPPLKEGRRSADRRVQDPHRKGMRRASFLLPPFYGGTEAQDFIEPWTSWSGRARLSAPHRGTHRGFTLGSARAALPGTTGCKREDPLRHQCSEHLAVRHVPDGTMPKPPASAVYRCAAREPLPLRP
jgi:hypothetical protein